MRSFVLCRTTFLKFSLKLLFSIAIFVSKLICTDHVSPLTGFVPKLIKYNKITNLYAYRITNKLLQLCTYK